MVSESKKIFATLLSTPSYLPGVKVLYRSLKKYGKTQYPFVCFCSKELPQRCIEELSEEGINCVRLIKSASEGVELPFQKQDKSRLHWSNTFDKLLLWGMAQYERIVFLDADMIVLSNIDELFSKPDMSAVCAGHFKFPDWVRLNSGCVVFQPNKEIGEQLLQAIGPAIEERVSQGESFGDQDVLNFVFASWPSDKELHLHEEYNVFYPFLSEFVAVFKRKPKIVHFIGSSKPWINKGFSPEIRYMVQLMRHKRECFMPYLKYKLLMWF